jgi:hypothetical protein
MEKRRVALDSRDTYKAIKERQRNIRRLIERKRFLRLPLL